MAILKKGIPHKEDWNNPTKIVKIESDCHYMFYCPGCQEYHAYRVPDWTFNGNMDRPTFTPSLLHSGKDYPGNQCYLFVTDGKIHYCSDCDHSLAGQTVDMVDMDTL